MAEKEHWRVLDSQPLPVGVKSVHSIYDFVDTMNKLLVEGCLKIQIIRERDHDSIQILILDKTKVKESMSEKVSVKRPVDIPKHVISVQKPVEPEPEKIGKIVPKPVKGRKGWGEAKAKVLKALRKESPAKVSRIAELSGLKASQASNALCYLKERGQVEKVKWGVFALKKSPLSPPTSPSKPPSVAPPHRAPVKKPEPEQHVKRVLSVIEIRKGVISAFKNANKSGQGLSLVELHDTFRDASYDQIRGVVADLLRDRFVVRRSNLLYWNERLAPSSALGDVAKLKKAS